MKAKEIEQSKPRNFVAKNAKMGGAGQHKDKKKAAKQGDIKHKAKEYSETIEVRFARKLAESTGMMENDPKHLAGEYSDFHKDLHGMRPRHSENEWNDPEFLQMQIDKLHSTLEKMKSTPEGRKALEDEGWSFNDTPSESSVNELSRDTLSNYSDKADMDIVKKHRVREPQRQAGDKGAVARTDKTINKRMSGIDRANSRLNKGVEEGVAETLPMQDAVKVLKNYGAEHFKTTSNELHFYKDGRGLSVDLVWNDDATRSVSLSSLNSATRRLKGQGVAEGEYRRPGSPTAYNRDYQSSVSGMGKRDSVAYQQDGGANDEGEADEPRSKYQAPQDKPVLQGYYFYNVPAGKEQEAATYGIKQTKSGKWAKAKYSTSGSSFGMQKDMADKAFGPGKYWAPK